MSPKERVLANIVASKLAQNKELAEKIGVTVRIRQIKKK